MANKWLAHMAKVRKQYPNLHFTEVAKKAKATYHSHQKGGAAMGGDLSPTDFHPNPKFPTSGGADLQVEATKYSGGKKSRRSKSSKKSRKARKTRKSKSRKRH
jgi:hypothetical protein